MFVRLARPCASASWRTAGTSAGACAGSSKRWQSTRVAGNEFLHLHPTATKNRYALSFLPSPPVSEASPTVIGTIEGTDITPRNFTENPEWRMMMHEILQNVVWEDENLKTQAANRIEGYLHIIGA